LATERIGKRQAGFTLIEVVVAFVLLTLVLSVSFEIFSRGMARAGDLEDNSRALVVAQSRLALAASEELKEGESAGDSDDRRFHWATSVRRYEEAVQVGPTAPVTFAPAYAMYRIDTRVTWRAADTREHALALATLVVGGKP
jgi:general secretion pathway protein I